MLDFSVVAVPDLCVVVVVVPSRNRIDPIESGAESRAIKRPF